jgi:hypothetical protein
MTNTIRTDRTRREKLNVLAGKYVVKTSENYQGLSYGDIIVTWLRWLLSDDPLKNPYGCIFFLRGSIGFHQTSLSYLQSSIEIPQGIAILVPIVTTHYNLGQYYNGLVIKDEYYLRKAIREHVDAAGPFWATIEMRYNIPKVVRMVSNLELFRVESMPFELNISEKNPFLDKMDEPNYAGKHTALVAGYFVVLQNLPPLSYRIRFGGYGMDGFYTESLYEIKIKTAKNKSKDISGPNFTPEHLLQEKKNAISTKSM